MRCLPCAVQRAIISAVKMCRYVNCAQIFGRFGRRQYAKSFVRQFHVKMRVNFCAKCSGGYINVTLFVTEIGTIKMEI